MTLRVSAASVTSAMPTGGVVPTNESVKFEDGYLVISDKPGLGIDVNVEEIEKRPYKPRNLRHYIGTLTDIRPKGDTFYFFDGLDCEHPVF